MDPSLEAARFLARLRETRQIREAIPEEFRPAGLPQAYAVQQALVDELLSRHGGERAGYKIGCTNRSAQELLKVDSPLYGCLLSSFIHSSPARLKAADFVHRCIEAEFALELADAVPAAGVPYTRESIAPLVRAVIPSIEIVDWRYADWTAVGACSLIADNAIHGAWVRGEPYTGWRDWDLGSHAVRLFVHDELVREGSGKAVLGHPFNVLAWLANELPKQGRLLEAGDLVTTGLTTEVYLAEAGDRIRADFGALGAVELEFT